MLIVCKDDILSRGTLGSVLFYSSGLRHMGAFSEELRLPLPLQKHTHSPTTNTHTPGNNKSVNAYLFASRSQNALLYNLWRPRTRRRQAREMRNAKSKTRQQKETEIGLFIWYILRWWSFFGIGQRDPRKKCPSSHRTWWLSGVRGQSLRSNCSPSITTAECRPPSLLLANRSSGPKRPINPTAAETEAQTRCEFRSEPKLSSSAAACVTCDGPTATGRASTWSRLAEPPGGTCFWGGPRVWMVLRLRSGAGGTFGANFGEFRMPAGKERAMERWPQRAPPARGVALSAA